MIKAAEIHLKVNPDYINEKSNDMFLVDEPLYSVRMQKVMNAIDVDTRTLINLQVKDVAVKERIRQILDNDYVPDYELFKKIFGQYSNVNYDYLLDGTGSPLAQETEKQFYKTYENESIVTILQEAIGAYKRLVDEKEKTADMLIKENMS